jgi:enamine deaminase RidA (YjgF/YER057c/UK114 family)
LSAIKRFETNGRMSQAVVHNGTIYLAGQVGRAGENVVAQFDTALGEIDRLLAEQGSSKSRLLQCTIWLASINDFAAINRVWENWIDKGNPPARATCEARLVDPAYRVEVIAVAAV